MRFDYLLHDFLQWRTGDAIRLAERPTFCLPTT